MVNSVPSFVSLALVVGSVGGVDTGSPAVLIIPPGTPQLRIQLSLRENDYRSCQAVLEAAGGKEIVNHQSLQARTAKTGARLAFIIPNKFATGDYILTLKGVTQNDEVEDVSFSLFHGEKN
jgi:hypothetical protein